MKSFLQKIEKLDFGWNKRSLTQEDFYDLCRRLKIKVEELPLLTVDGAYSCDKKKHFIAVNSRLPLMRQTFVMFHEFGHYLMHLPSTGPIDRQCSAPTKRRSREEREADAFAYCAVLPLSLMSSRPDEEIADLFGNTFFMERLAVYERYKI